MGYSKWYQNFVKKYKTIGNLKKVTNPIKKKERKISKLLEEALK